MLDLWLGRKVVKRCPRGHWMELGLRRCPSCFSGAQEAAAPRDIAERTVLLGAEARPAERPLRAPAVTATVVRLRATAGPLAGRQMTLEEGLHRLGKAPKEEAGSYAIRVAEDPFLSREHAVLSVSGSRLGVKDLGSTNGTHVNGQRITQAELHDGDELRLGESAFRVEIGPAGS